MAKSTPKSSKPGKPPGGQEKANNRAKKAQPEAGRKRIPTSAWIINLVLAVGFLAFLLYLSDVPNTRLDDSLKGDSKQANETPEEAETQDAGRIDYRYEKMLPNAEVIPPNVSDYRPTQDSKTILYRLQTGSFRTEEGAEAQKAAIAFQGIRAHIRPVSSSSGTVWHRVEVGPIQSRSQMNRVVDKLVEININPIVRKIEAED